MIAICEECGQKYRIDPEKIKGEKAKFKCRSCSHIISVTKPQVEEAEPPPPPPPPPPPAEESEAPEEEARSTASPKEEETVPEKKKPSKKLGLNAKGLGLRSKMFFLFFIPIILIIAAGLLYIRELNKLSGMITGESSQMVTRMAEQIIADKARSVAFEVNLYLRSNPSLIEEDFNSPEHDFKAVAVQKVGLTGYTALYELPGEDGIWRTWAHVNSKIIGIDMSKLKKPLGRNFPGFWRIYTGVKGEKESKGYYTWQDKDKSFREKFMVCTPVKGTPYIIAATTYLDEFTKPVKMMEMRALEITSGTKLITFGILGGTLLLIGAIVLLYGHSLTSRLKSLSSLAERISVGELDAEVEDQSKDEIGDLAEAISRMQESIRLSIERLRRRR